MMVVKILPAILVYGSGMASLSLCEVGVNGPPITLAVCTDMLKALHSSYAITVVTRRLCDGVRH